MTYDRYVTLKQKILLVLTIGFLLCSTVGTAQSAIIVDTGTPTNTILVWNLDSEYWLAGEFTISQDYIITDVLGYMWGTDKANGSSLTAAIYDGGVEVPGPELFSNRFSVGDSAGWYGASGIDWWLEAGTYWAAFKVAAGDDYDGAMPFNVPNPLDNEARWDTTGGWYADDSLSLGIRILGDPATIPEPATIFLFGFGLLGLAGVYRRKK